MPKSNASSLLMYGRCLLVSLHRCMLTLQVGKAQAHNSPGTDIYEASEDATDSAGNKASVGQAEARAEAEVCTMPAACSLKCSAVLCCSSRHSRANTAHSPRH